MEMIDFMLPNAGSRSHLVAFYQVPLRSLRPVALVLRGERLIETRKLRQPSSLTVLLRSMMTGLMKTDCLSLSQAQVHDKTWKRITT